MTEYTSRKRNYSSYQSDQHSKYDRSPRRYPRRVQSRDYRPPLQHNRNRSHSRRRFDSRWRRRSYHSPSSSHGSSSVDDEVGHFNARDGEIINERYEIKCLLGTGTFGKVYKCYDVKYKENIALKVVRNIPRYIDSAKIEGKILDDIYRHQKKLLLLSTATAGTLSSSSSTAMSSLERDVAVTVHGTSTQQQDEQQQNQEQQQQKQKNIDFCVKMYSRFAYHGHYCMVFERLGSSLYDIIKANDYKRLPLPMIQSIGLQLLQAMQFLQSMQLIHTDLKLENILFVHTTLQTFTVRQPSPPLFSSQQHRNGDSNNGNTTISANKEYYEILAPVDPRIKLIDFGGATYDHDPAKSRIVNTRQYRGPEVTLEVGWSYPSDIWSTACVISEIYSGDLLFQTHEELEHLALMEKLCGHFPEIMIHDSPVANKYFDRNNRVKVSELDQESSQFVQQAKYLEEFFSLDDEESNQTICHLMKGLLRLDPKKRLTAEEALLHPFFNLAIPNSQPIIQSKQVSQQQQQELSPSITTTTVTLSS